MLHCGMTLCYRTRSRMRKLIDLVLFLLAFVAISKADLCYPIPIIQPVPTQSQPQTDLSTCCQYRGNSCCPAIGKFALQTAQRA
jgi:hypothetical protein